MSGSVEIIARQYELEADRVLTICNACRYCEGLCATFKAMTEHRTFLSSDLSHLANLCHNCTACLPNCQYAAPHEFAVNVPNTLTNLRLSSYERYAWPPALGRVYRNNGVLLTAVIGLVLFAWLWGGALFVESGELLAESVVQGNFYAVVSHQVMMTMGLVTGGFAFFVLVMSARRCWHEIGTQKMTWKAIRGALVSSATLENLGGGHGQGCEEVDGVLTGRRRLFHHFTMYGFLLCFAATCVATFYDYALGLPAPYAFFSLPVILGTVGGIGLLIGPVGLYLLKRKSAPEVTTAAQKSLDVPFLAALFLVSATGLLLLAFRSTNAMPILLLIHLGFVFGFFIALPYTKFVHGLYRFLALVEYSKSRAN